MRHLCKANKIVVARSRSVESMCALKDAGAVLRHVIY